MSVKSAAPAQRSPLLALWSRDDPRTAVIDFLPTRTIAVLPIVAKPLRDVQSCLLLTAIKRRAKTTVPSPPTTRALLDALLVGEPQFFCETWERGLPEGCLQLNEFDPLARDSSVKQSPDGGYFLELSGGNNYHRGYALPLQAPNLLVRRLRVTMSYADIHGDSLGGAVGYVMLCGPGAEGAVALDDFMGGPRFGVGENDQVSLKWLQYVHDGDNDDRILVEGATPNTRYVVEAVFQHESVTSCFGTVDISVNGQRVPGLVSIVYNPLSSIKLYNWSRGTSQIGEIDVWYEKATPNQAWKFDLDDYR